MDEGSISVIAGGGMSFADATGALAGFEDIRSMRFDGNQRLVVIDGNRLRHCSKRGVVKTFCGDRASGYVDGPAAVARFNEPSAVAFDAHDGSLYVADQANYRIRRITAQLQVSTRAGDGQCRDRDGSGAAASIGEPVSLACLSGWVYFLDKFSGTIRCISPTGTVTTIAGSKKKGLIDAVGPEALLNVTFDSHICTDGRGRFVFLDGKDLQTRLRSFHARQHGLTAALETTLLGDLDALLDDEAATDLKVVAKDGRATHTLRGLLIARSEYFKAMLCSQCQEGAGSAGAITLQNSFPAVRALIRYLHTDKLEVADEAMVEILELSEMTGLPRLKALAEEEIAKRVSPANVSIILESAQRHGAASLRTFALNYITNHFTAVRGQASFRQLSKEALLEVMLAIEPGGI